MTLTQIGAARETQWVGLVETTTPALSVIPKYFGTVTARSAVIYPVRAIAVLSRTNGLPSILKYPECTADLSLPGGVGSTDLPENCLCMRIGFISDDFLFWDFSSFFDFGISGF